MLFNKGLGLSPNLNKFTSRLFYTGNGQLLVSALFGIALALVFQKVCSDRKCIVIRGVAPAEVTGKTFEFEGECFKYKPSPVECPEDKERLIPVN